ncbi:MAG: 30S ribosomal protein S6 [Ignavibacterium sp.]|jgi:small subunit ribosomal protein S6|uniref:Small ribosomal subunit protein bS6 n=1 Tax=Ignavibacterium album TaxID=591197 RepID=A0A7V2ZMS2_9BACT|nr:30S ribosomal protein S6 [Ignavibacterium album]MCA2004533.1 30S ribosomal protein S6 [Ignavibacterium sp.]MCX8106043.1 30S ribosomal protein S6 [Ignavibacterium album]
MKSGVYESAILINAALEDNQIESVINRVKEFITTNGGQIRDFENWGRKRLAYPVEKSKIGYYAIFRFDAPGSIVSKLERFYNLDEHILRYLTIKLSKEALEQIEKNKTQSVSIKEDSIPEPEVNLQAEEEEEIEDNDKN